MSWGKVAIFAGGALFGSVGVKLLSGRDAKKVYTHCTAAVLRAKEAALDQATVLKENCTDIYEEAKQINEERQTESGDEVIEDAPAKASSKSAASSGHKRSSAARRAKKS